GGGEPRAPGAWQPPAHGEEETARGRVSLRTGQQRGQRPHGHPLPARQQPAPSELSPPGEELVVEVDADRADVLARAAGAAGAGKGPGGRGRAGPAQEWSRSVPLP